MLSNGFMASCHSYEICKSRFIKIEQDADGLLKINGCLISNSKNRDQKYKFKSYVGGNLKLIPLKNDSKI